MEKLNITYEFEKAYTIFSNMINQGYTIKQIADTYDLYAYEVIHNLLIKGKDDINILKAILNHYKSYKINDNKVLVISDTHTGRLSYDEDNNYENQWLKNEIGVYNAYKYADKNNIKTIIHAGDLLEGNSNPYTKKIMVKDQFKYLNKFYPILPNIKTYLLFGNHDYNIIYYNSFDFKEQIKNIPQLDIIGVNYSYVNFNNKLLKISHNCSTSDFYNNIDLPYNFELSGHSHIFSIYDDERIIKVPTLSSVNIDKNYIGFLEITEEENEYVIRFLDDNTKLKNEKVLSKKKKLSV